MSYQKLRFAAPGILAFYEAGLKSEQGVVGCPCNSCAAMAPVVRFVTHSPLLGKIADDAPILVASVAPSSIRKKLLVQFQFDFSVSRNHSEWCLQQSGPTSNAGSSQEQWQKVVLFGETSEASLTDSSQLIGRGSIPGIWIFNNACPLGLASTCTGYLYTNFFLKSYFY